MNYSPSCRSKPVRPLFIFGTQIKTFLMKSESSLTLHRQQCSQVQKHSKYIGKTVHVTSVAQLQFCDATRILFLCKEIKNNNLLNHSSPPSYVLKNKEVLGVQKGFQGITVKTSIVSLIFKSVLFKKTLYYTVCEH